MDARLDLGNGYSVSLDAPAQTCGIHNVPTIDARCVECDAGKPELFTVQVDGELVNVESLGNILSAFKRARELYPNAVTVADTAGMARYPHRGENGETVWACCESAIGPKCRHMA